MQVIPFQLRLKDLCTREYARIAAKQDSHSLVKLMENSTSKGNDYCPLAYIKVFSKEWIQETMDQRVRSPCNSPEEIITKAQTVNKFELFDKNAIETLEIGLKHRNGMAGKLWMTLYNLRKAKQQWHLQMAL